ncbi:MAG TPA: aldo/keto reductase [Rhodopila sp.]
MCRGSHTGSPPKLCFPMSNTDRGLSRTQILKRIDAFPARLKVDHVDLHQCHRYDSDAMLEEAMAALADVAGTRAERRHLLLRRGQDATPRHRDGMP